MPKLEALTTGQLLDRIFFLYRKNFLLFFTIALIPQLVKFCIQAIAIVAGRSGTAGGMITTAVAFILGILLFLAALSVSQGATTVAVSDVYLSQPASTSGSYRRTLPMTLRLIGMMFGYGLLCGVGFILLIVPGVYFLITYALATAVMAIEKVSFSEAMTRSKDLVQGQRGRIALIIILSFVMSFVLAFGLALPAQLASLALVKISPVLSVILNSGVDVIASALAAPVGLIGFTLAYYDARVRKEAFDLEYMMQSEAAAAATGTPGQV